MKNFSYFGRQIKLKKFDDFCFVETNNLLKKEFKIFNCDYDDNDMKGKHNFLSLQEKLLDYYLKHPLSEKDIMFKYLSKQGMGELLHKLINPFRNSLDNIPNIHTQLDQNKVEEVTSAAIQIFKNIFKIENISVSFENDVNTTSGTASSIKLFFDNASPDLKTVTKNIVDYTVSEDNFNFIGGEKVHVSVFIPRSLVKAFIIVFNGCKGDQKNISKLEDIFITLFMNSFYAVAFKENYRENFMNAVYTMMRHYRDASVKAANTPIKDNWNPEVLITQSMIDENLLIKEIMLRKKDLEHEKYIDKLISPFPCSLTDLHIDEIYNCVTTVPQWLLNEYMRSMKISDSFLLDAIIIINDSSSISNINIDFSENSSNFIASCILFKRYITSVLIKTLFSKDKRNKDLFKSYIHGIIIDPSFDNDKYKATSFTHEKSFNMVSSLKELLIYFSNKLNNSYVDMFIENEFHSCGDRCLCENLCNCCIEEGE